jgi:hypothetical protein
MSFIPDFIAYCKKQHESPHKSMSLLVYRLDQVKLRPGMTMSEIAVIWAEDSEMYWFEREPLWDEITKFLEAHHGPEWAITLVTENDEGASFSPTRRNPPQFVQDITTAIYMGYLAEMRSVN